MATGRKTLSEKKDLLKICYYGESGSGKTTAAAAMARLGKVLVVDAESGLKSKPLKQLGIPTENIELFDDISFGGLEALFLELRGELHKNPDAYVGIIIDSVTEIQKKLQENVMSVAILKAERKGVERDRFSVYTEDWGQLSGQTRLLIRGFRDLPCHVAFTALERRDQDDDGVVQYGPAMTPGVQGDLKGYVDLGCYMKPQDSQKGGEGVIFTGIFRPVGKFWAKDRFNAMPRVLVDPYVDRVVQYIDGAYDVKATIKAAKLGAVDGKGVDPIQAKWRISVTESKGEQ